jgi:hypothetical protein
MWERNFWEKRAQFVREWRGTISAKFFTIIYGRLRFFSRYSFSKRFIQSHFISAAPLSRWPAQRVLYLSTTFLRSVGPDSTPSRDRSSRGATTLDSHIILSPIILIGDFIFLVVYP